MSCVLKEYYNFIYICRVWMKLIRKQWTSFCWILMEQKTKVGEFDIKISLLLNYKYTESSRNSIYYIHYEKGYLNQTSSLLSSISIWSFWWIFAYSASNRIFLPGLQIKINPLLSIKFMQSQSENDAVMSKMSRWIIVRIMSILVSE